jgi:hypothetical protein
MFHSNDVREEMLAKKFQDFSSSEFGIQHTWRSEGEVMEVQ